MKVLLLGSTGQIGVAVQKLAHSEHWPKDWSLISWGRAQGDLSNPDQLIQKISAIKPDLIWNAAAYTQVDRAQSEVDLCRTINAMAPAALARYAHEHQIALIHYSTDYVYGSSALPLSHEETETGGPLNEYGQTKLEGDLAIEASGCEHLIFRTSWVYSFHGKNFVKTMLRLSKEKSELSVVGDQVGGPSYAPDLALYSLKAIEVALKLRAQGKVFPTGIYHLANAGHASWSDFAKAILPGFSIRTITTAEYPTPAKRPLNSRLSLARFEKTFGIHPRPWQEALRDCLLEIAKND